MGFISTLDDICSQLCSESDSTSASIRFWLCSFLSTRFSIEGSTVVPRGYRKYFQTPFSQQIYNNSVVIFWWNMNETEVLSLTENTVFNGIEHLCRLDAGYVTFIQCNSKTLLQPCCNCFHLSYHLAQCLQVPHYLL